MQDIALATHNSDPYGLVAVGERLFFVMTVNQQYNHDLWRTDGTLEGTVQVKDVSPGCDLTGFASSLYFTTGEGEHGFESWRSDGTPAGTRLSADINLGGGSSDPYEFVQAGGRRFLEPSLRSSALNYGSPVQAQMAQA